MESQDKSSCLDGTTKGMMDKPREMVDFAYGGGQGELVVIRISSWEEELVMQQWKQDKSEPASTSFVSC